MALTTAFMLVAGIQAALAIPLGRFPRIVGIANFQLNALYQRAWLITAIFAWAAHNPIIGSMPGLFSNAAWCDFAARAGYLYGLFF